MLLNAIEQLRPAGSISPDSAVRRTYTILRERYVLRHSPPQVERQLNLGDRQVRREHKRAIAALASVLEPQFSATALVNPATPDQDESIRDAVHRLMPVPRLFGLAGR